MRYRVVLDFEGKYIIQRQPDPSKDSWQTWTTTEAFHGICIDKRLVRQYSEMEDAVRVMQSYIREKDSERAREEYMRNPVVVAEGKSEE